MNDKLINQLVTSFREKDDNELLQIWKTNDKNEWSSEAFEAVKIVLEGKNILLPSQDIFIAKKENESKYSSLSKRISSGIIDVIFIFLFNMLLVTAGLKSGIIFFLFWFAYFFITGLGGQSSGNFLMKIKIVNLNGEKPTTEEIALRALCTCIPFLPLTYNGETFLHDRLSKTYITDITYSATIS